MKWLAAMLFVANIALWFYGGHGAAVSREIKAEGQLPRVSGLEIASAENNNEGLDQSLERGTQDPSWVRNDQEPSELCIEIGWFEDEASARDAASILGVTENIEHVRAVDRPQAPFHWVIVPPVPSRSEANQRYIEIQSMDIDAYLVAQGEQENAISLGLFESRAAAERVLERRKAQGLNAKLATFPRNRISYALVFSAVLRSGTEAGKLLLGGYKAQFESVKFSGCEGVATTAKSP
jgi:hypothetical protein